MHSHRPKPLQAGLGMRVWSAFGATAALSPAQTSPGFHLFKEVSGCVFGAHPSATAACSPAQTNRTTVQPLQAGLGTRVWCTPECNCCMFTGPNEPHQGSTSSSRSRDACLVHTRVRLLHVHRPKRTAPGFNLFKQVSGRVFGAHPSATAACSPAQTNRTTVQPLQAGLGTRVWCTPECNCCMFTGPNEPLQGSTSSSRSRDACLVHTRVQLLHVHRPKRTAPRFNLFKQVSGRVFGAHPSATAACSPAQTNRTRVQPLQAGLGTRVWCTPECDCCMFTGPNEPHQVSTSSSRSRDACLVCFWCDCCILTGPNLFKQVSGRMFGAHPSAIAACSPAQTNRSRVPPLQGGLGTRVWCTPECDCCMFTGPNEPLQGSTSSRRSRDACLVRFWCTPECDCCILTGPNEPHQERKPTLVRFNN